MTAAASETVTRYAAYLKSRGLNPKVTLSRSRAAITATGSDGGELHIALAPAARLGWEVTWIHVSHGDKTACFGQGQIGAAVAALLTGGGAA